jgi:hypothetical protein
MYKLASSESYCPKTPLLANGMQKRLCPPTSESPNLRDTKVGLPEQEAKVLFLAIRAPASHDKMYLLPREGNSHTCGHEWYKDKALFTY